MRRLVLGLVALAAGAVPARAQQPSLSRLLQPILQRDTAVTVWLFARPGRGLDDVARAVTAAGGRVRQRSTWLNAVSARVSTSALRTLLRDRTLQHIQPVGRFRRAPEPRPAPAVAPPLTAGPRAPRSPQASRADSLYGPSSMPIRRLNLLPLVDRGFRGTGIRIALLDTGFETLRPDFAAAHVIAQRDFVFQDSVVRNDPADGAVPASQHGTSTWSLLAANDPGLMVGIAPDALYILAKTEDIRTETRVEEDNYVAALEWADSLGAKVVSSSLGYLCFDPCNAGGFKYTFAQLNGDVAVTTKAADIAAQRGILVVTAMGNSGAQGFRTVETPADGDSVVSVGAVDSLDAIAGFSSKGPTADGRTKPDLTAPGVAIFVVDPQQSGGFARSDGTSFSTPIVAGAAALLRQIHPTLGPIAIRDALRAAGSHASAPDTTFGWGTPDALRAATFPGGVTLAPAPDTLLDTVTPTLSWSVVDPPGFALPISYRVRVTDQPTFDAVILDTVLTGTSLALLKPVAPGAHLLVDVTATAADTVTVSTRTPLPLVGPVWAKLLTLNQPAGSTIRDVRPTFLWSSPGALEPPGPFVYTLTVLRAEDGSVELSTAGLHGTSYTPPQDLERNTPYRWTLTAHVGKDSTIVQSQGTFVITSDLAPPVTLLFQNFPNPFPNVAIGQPVTCFWFDLANPGQVKLEILDVLGHVVRRLIPGSVYGPFLRSGRYGRPLSTDVAGCDPALEWDGTAADGSAAARGIYIAKLETPDGVFFKRIVFLGR